MRLPPSQNAIVARRTIKQFATQPVPRELLRYLLELAVWAPNHQLTEPWRFYVFDGASKRSVAEIGRQIATAKLLRGGAEQDVAQRKAEGVAQEWAAVPALVLVTMVSDPDAFRDRENYGAVCCAIQNLMLGAQTLGLATFWGTGEVAFAPGLAELAGAGANEQVVGLIRIGYALPDAPKQSRRTQAANFTRWIDPAE
ncbi:MAG: nitroreductase [Anaerolineales bacterium]|nr:nitroreductase [Anaerolineales bacterium]